MNSRQQIIDILTYLGVADRVIKPSDEIVDSILRVFLALECMQDEEEVIEEVYSQMAEQNFTVPDVITQERNALRAEIRKAISDE